MRMTSNDQGSNKDSRVARRLALTAAAALLAGTLVAGCGGGGDSDAGDDAAAAAKPARPDNAAGANPPANAADKQSRLAEAVVDGKTTAPVDMKYDLLAKPAPGQPFELELTFETRLPADSLDIVLTEAPGLTIVGERTATFAPVEGGQTYTSKVLVQGDTAGLYYVGIVANMVTAVQTETRAFAVPIVVGDPPVQKASPSKDASGQAIESMPAQEPR
jgi:hypothetical protein